MKTMQAIVKKNESDTTFSKEEVNIPQIASDELLVQIKAIGVGIHDGYFLPEEIQFPYPLGIEGAGIIREVGSEAEEFSVGERIAFVSSMQAKGGTWAEYAVVSKDALILKMPNGMNFTTAAAIPVAGHTVLKAFHELPLERGDSLFIAGASGEIGTFAIQLAKMRDFKIASSASLKNHAYMQSLGADLTVDYHDPNWPEQVKEWSSGGVDAAIAIQPGTGEESIAVIKDGGVVVPVSDYQLTGERNVVVRTLSHHADVRAELMEMMEQIGSNKIQLTIEQVYTFDEALEALEKTTTRRARGKLVIDMEK